MSIRSKSAVLCLGVSALALAVASQAQAQTSAEPSMLEEVSYVAGLASTSGGGRIVTPTLPRIFGFEVQARF